LKLGIIKSNRLYFETRLNSDFHLSEGVQIRLKIREHPHASLGEITSNVFCAGRGKRNYVESKFGIPMLSNTDMVSSSPLNTSKFVSKVHGEKEFDKLKQGMILTSRVGSIGLVSYVRQDMHNFLGSDNIIRITPDNSKYNGGVIYAFLLSKYGQNLLKQISTGAVQPFLDVKTLMAIPIPLLSQPLMLEIHNLVEEAAQLRTEANYLLGNCLDELNEQSTDQIIRNTFTSKFFSIRDGDKFTKELRLEADYYKQNVDQLRESIKLKNHAYLGDLCTLIQRSGIRERKFVEKGIPFITGQNLNLLSNESFKFVSEKLTKNIQKNLTTDGDLIISCQGTVGKVELAFKNFYTQVFASDKVLRVSINKDKIHPGYLYLYLLSTPGQQQMMKYKTGTVVEWIRENNLASILIPIPSDKGEKMGFVALTAIEMRQLAFEKENQAIALIEKALQ
jgi:type I restriction enzyme, S subunit